MPFYTYTCPDCGAAVTEMRKVADRDDPTECPVSARENLYYYPGTLMVRGVEGPAFHLKGKAWAKDGYGG